MKIKLSNFNVERERAKQSFAKGHYDQALSHFQNCISIDPFYTDGYFYVGLCTFRTGEIENAESYLERNLKLNKGQIDVYFHLSYMFEKLEEFEIVMPWFKEAVFSQAGENIFYQMGLAAESVHLVDYAVNLYQEARRIQPDSKSIVSTLTALLIEEKDFEKTEEVLKSCLELYPDEIVFIFRLGLALKAQNKIESAIVQFNQVLSLQADHVDSLLNLAESCIQAGFLKQAEAFYQSVQQLDASRLEVILGQGQLYEKMEKNEQAAMKYRLWVESMEDKIWHQNQHMQKMFKASCLFIANYYQKKGKPEDSALFKRRAEVVQMDEMGGLYAVSETHGHSQINKKK